MSIYISIKWGQPLLSQNIGKLCRTASSSNCDALIFLSCGGERFALTGVLCCCWWSDDRAQVVAISFIGPVNSINATLVQDCAIWRRCEKRQKGRSKVCLKIINRGLMVRPFLMGLLACDFVNYQVTTCYRIGDIFVFENLICSSLT